MSTLFGRPVGRAGLREVLGAFEQAIGVELIELGEGAGRGLRLARVRTGEIDFEVVLDRAADLGRASIRGIPIAWLPPTGMVAPGLVERSSWGPLRSFGGGLLTTCGLDHALAPARVPADRYGLPARRADDMPLHGRLSGTPSTLRGHGVDWSAPEPFAYVHAEVRQASLFGEQLTLTRTITAPIGGSTIVVEDTVENDGYAPTPHAVLYHVNFGWPLLGDATELIVPARRSTGIGHHVPHDRVVDFAPRELVWEHEPAPGADGRVRLAALNRDIGDGRGAGLALTYDTAQLGHLLQWRARGPGHHVAAFEPTTLSVLAPAATEELAPGDRRTYRLAIALLRDPLRPAD